MYRMDQLGSEWEMTEMTFTFANLFCFRLPHSSRNAPHGIQGASSCRMKGSAPWLSNTSTGWSDWHWTAWLSQLTRHPKYAPELSELGLEHAKYGQIHSFGIVWCSLLTDNPPVCRDVPYLYWCIKDSRIFHDHGRTKSQPELEPFKIQSFPLARTPPPDLAQLYS